MIEFACGVLIAIPAMTLPFLGLGLVVFYVTIMRGQVVAASARVAGVSTVFDDLAPVYAAAVVLLAVGAATLQVVDWCHPNPT